MESEPYVTPNLIVNVNSMGEGNPIASRGLQNRNFQLKVLGVSDFRGGADSKNLTQYNYLPLSVLLIKVRIIEPTNLLKYIR